MRISLCVCVRARVSACACACLCMFVRACVCMCVNAHVFVLMPHATGWRLISATKEAGTSMRPSPLPRGQALQLSQVGRRCSSTKGGRRQCATKQSEWTGAHCGQGGRHSTRPSVQKQALRAAKRTETSAQCDQAYRNRRCMRPSVQKQAQHAAKGTGGSSLGALRQQGS